MEDRLNIFKKNINHEYERVVAELTNLEVLIEQIQILRNQKEHLEAILERISKFESEGLLLPPEPEKTAIDIVRQLFNNNPEKDWMPAEVNLELHNAFRRGEFKTRGGTYNRNLAYNILAQLLKQGFVQKEQQLSDSQTSYRKNTATIPSTTST